MGIVYREDDDLEFLQYCSEEDIHQLARYLIYDGDGQKRSTSEILNDEKFKSLDGQPDKWRASWKLVAGELQHFGGDSVVNFFRGNGVLYKEIVCDVCDNLMIGFDKKSSTYDIESLLIEKISEVFWNKMSEGEKKKFFDFIGISYGFLGVPLSFIIGMSLIDSRKIGFFKLSSWLAQSTLLAFSRTAHFGFIGLAVVPLISGAAYQVTTPSAIQIAYMRRKYEQEDRFK